MFLQVDCHWKESYDGGVQENLWYHHPKYPSDDGPKSRPKCDLQIKVGGFQDPHRWISWVKYSIVGPLND